MNIPLSKLSRSVSRRALEKTAPSSPVEEVVRVEPMRVKDDALDGLAEELLLDERLPVGLLSRVFIVESRRSARIWSQAGLEKALKQPRFGGFWKG